MSSVRLFQDPYLIRDFDLIRVKVSRVFTQETDPPDRFEITASRIFVLPRNRGR